MDSLRDVYNLVLRYKGASLNSEECKIFEKLDRELTFGRMMKAMLEVKVTNEDKHLMHLEVKKTADYNSYVLEPLKEYLEEK